MVTHDEDMNYYFVKDKAGDETDEFYEDFEMRKERAERYRKHFAIEQPMMLLKNMLCMSVIYIILFLFLANGSAYQNFLMWVYTIYVAIEITCIYFSMLSGR